MKAPFGSTNSDRISLGDLRNNNITSIWQSVYLGRISCDLGHFRRLDDLRVSIVEQHVILVCKKDLLGTTSGQKKTLQASEESNVKSTGTQSSLFRSRLGVRLGRLPFVRTALTLAGYFFPSAHVASIRSPTENSRIFASLQVRNPGIIHVNGVQNEHGQAWGSRKRGKTIRGVGVGERQKKYESRVVGVSHFSSPSPEL